MVLNYISNLDYSLNKAIFKASKVRTFSLLGISIILSIIYNISSSIIIEQLAGEGLKVNALDGFSPLGTFVLVTAVAPLVETLIFQYLVIEGVCFLSKSKVLALALSAIIFALSHSHSFNYILFAVIPGFILGALYLILKYKQKPAFILVCLTHPFINLYSFIHNSFLTKLAVNL